MPWAVVVFGIVDVNCQTHQREWTMLHDQPYQVHTTFDYWADLNPGRSVWDAKGSIDPDTRSLRLRAAHQALWTKQLPSGAPFALAPVRGTQLQWNKYRLSSDSISNSYMTNHRVRPLLEQARREAEELFRCGSTIGAYILFPAYRVDGQMTINGARGMIRAIGDRMDLTLEAIRRHYHGEASPLAEVLRRYSDFFALFHTFPEYVDFWLLNDLVDNQYRVQFFLPLDNFSRNGAPSTVSEYLQLARASTRFLHARTARMSAQLSA